MHIFERETAHYRGLRAPDLERDRLPPDLERPRLPRRLDGGDLERDRPRRRSTEAVSHVPLFQAHPSDEVLQVLQWVMSPQFETSASHPIMAIST